jgi:hypothetical protein
MMEHKIRSPSGHSRKDRCPHLLDSCLARRGEGMPRSYKGLLGEEEANPREMANVVSFPEDSNRVTHEEMIRTAEDQSQDRRKALWMAE